MAMDIAAFEIHVIQREMMGSFIFLRDLCFFFIWDKGGIRFSGQPKKEGVFQSWFFIFHGKKWVGIGIIWAHFAPRSQAELRKDVVTFSSVTVNVGKAECQRRYWESRSCHGNLRYPPQSYPPKKYGPNKALFIGGGSFGGGAWDSHDHGECWVPSWWNLSWNLGTTLDLKVRKPKTFDLGFTHNQCQCH